MAAIVVGPRRRKQKLVALFLLVALTLLVREYIAIGFNILIRGPFIAHFLSDSQKLSLQKDGFDITFKSYPATPQRHQNTSLPVPPIIHHIRLGSKAINKNITAARDACLAMHPAYEFKYWTDNTANDFVATHFPELFPMWKSYPYTIQRADSLRYMVLYVYGGTFLDLDLECLRPLDPLRRFPFLAPAATPMGISNGFIMATPQHSFLKFVLNNLPRYNIAWLHLPYTIVMFSTGCHFLSTMQALFPDRANLRILWGPGHMHQLSGAVTTPLFKHYGMSSWHSRDGAIISLFKPGGPMAVMFGVLFSHGLLVLGAVTGLAVWRWRKARRRRKGRWEGEKMGRLNV